jgi:serine/threonine-protein kinase
VSGRPPAADPGASQIALETVRVLGARAAAAERDPRQTVRPEHWADAETARLDGWVDEIEAPGNAGAQSGLELGDTLGQGGMAVVRGALQRSLARPVAAKTLRAERRDAESARRLLREAWVTGAVEHPNVVPVHDLQLDADGRPVIVLKRIDGVGWRDLMDDPDRALGHADGADLLEWHLRVLIQVCRALELAHSRGIVHRDVKPDNVMLGEFGEVYLLDWGIAVSLADDRGGRLPLARDAREMAGSPAYMAPELLGNRAQDISPRTDVYLLGSCLFELLAGRPPHRGADLLETIDNVVRSEVELPDGVADELASICRRAMAREPRDRIDGAARFRVELETFLRHRTSLALSTEAADRLRSLEEELADDSAEDEAERRSRVHALFGACRFGFLQALSTWPENQDARSGLQRALEAMARFEIADGNPVAARLHLDELPSPSEALRREVGDALAAQAEEQARIEALERLGRDLDPMAAQRTRRWIATAMGAGFVVGSSIGLVRTGFLGDRQTRWELMATPSLFLVIALVLGWLGREGIRRTAINRRAYGAIVTALLALLLSHAGMLAMGASIPLCHAVDALIFAGIAAHFTVVVDRRMVVPTLAYLASFGFVVLWPDLRYWPMPVAHLVMTLTVWLAWSEPRDD